jgi:hypothetical protein
MKRNFTELPKDMADAIERSARSAEEVPEEERPDFVEVGGVKYYRHKQEPSPYDSGKPAGIQEGYTRVVINIAPHAPHIRLDNRLYYPNMEYDIRDDQVATFMEIMARTWYHERATGGANTNMEGARNTTFNLRTQAHRSHFGPPGVSG